MLYTIENDLIRVEIDSLGGEMMSVKTKADDTEYLWQGDPAYWKGRAFHLFPMCCTAENTPIRGKTIQ